MKDTKENDVMIKQQPKTNSVRMFDGDKALMDQFMKDEKKTQHILIHELLAEHKHKLFVEGHPDFQNEIEKFNKVNECAASMFLSLVNRYGNQSNVIRNEFQNELKANAQTINSLHTQISELTNKIKIMEDESLKTKNQLSNQIEVKDNLKSQNDTLKKENEVLKREIGNQTSFKQMYASEHQEYVALFDKFQKQNAEIQEFKIQINNMKYKMELMLQNEKNQRDFMTNLKEFFDEKCKDYDVLKIENESLKSEINKKSTQKVIRVGVRSYK